LSGSLSPNIPDIVGGPRAAGVLDDAAGYAEKPELDALEGHARARCQLSPWPRSIRFSSDSIRFFLANVGATGLSALTLSYSGLGSVAVGSLSPGQAYSTLVLDGRGK